MTGLIFPFLFGLNFLLFSPCEGQISLPPGGSTFVVLPREDVTIAWKIDVSISDVIVRSWTLFPKGNNFAEIIRDGKVDETPQYSPGPFTITKPSTLILKNVTIQYNGTYRFFIFAKGLIYASDVTVFVAVKPTVTINCPSAVIVNEGDHFTCVCRGEGGNPPADVTWYKDNVLIGRTGKEEQTLTRNNVDGIDSGTYKCVAQSHTLTGGKLVEVKVRPNYPPEEPFFKEKAVVGKTFAITCESNGYPSPSYTITHNNTKVVSNGKTYTVDVVQYSDAGFYKCIAANKLGNSSTIYHLSIIDQLINPTTGIATQNFSTTENSRSVNTAANKEDDGTTVVVWHIVVSLVSGIIIGILLSYIVWCSHHRWSRNRRPQSNPEPKPTEVDTTYQELDLTKMNTEDNYQSLKVNAASNDVGNDDDSTYTALNKTRDVENNYQSLT